jgi:hypothetical protein
MRSAPPAMRTAGSPRSRRSRLHGDFRGDGSSGRPDGEEAGTTTPKPESLREGSLTGAGGNEARRNSTGNCLSRHPSITSLRFIPPPDVTSRRPTVGVSNGRYATPGGPKRHCTKDSRHATSGGREDLRHPQTHAHTLRALLTRPPTPGLVMGRRARREDLRANRYVRRKSLRRCGRQSVAHAHPRRC